MKAKFILLLALLSFGIVNSQEINCAEKQNELSKQVENQDFKKATSTLNQLLTKCATHSEKMYQLGIQVQQYNVEVTYNDEKEAALKDLVKLYDQYDANFPENTNGNTINKAMLLYELGEENDIYTLLNKAFIKNKFQYTNPVALYTYFKLYCEKFKAENQEENFDSLLETYSNVNEVIQKNKTLVASKEVEFDNVSISSKKMIEDFLTKDNLVSYAEKKYFSNKTDASWLETTAAMLEEKCADTEVFGKIATQLNDLKPSSKSAYYLAMYNFKIQNIDKSILFFDKAISLTNDKLEKAKLHYTIAYITFTNNKLVAKTNALLAIENDKTNGEYFIFLANLYESAADECSNSVITKKAIYQLASQTAQKAAVVQLSLKPTADALSDGYKKHALTKAEQAEVKKLDNKVAISCWINETVQF